MSTTSQKINQIFDDNKVHDLKRFMKKRQEINNCNIRLRYLFYTFHYSSILVTTIAVGFHDNNSFEKTDVINLVNMVWLGIALNILSTLIHAIEKMNRNISKKLFVDINKIKSGEYIDETEMMDSVNDSSVKSKSNSKSNSKNDSAVIPL